MRCLVIRRVVKRTYIYYSFVKLKYKIITLYLVFRFYRSVWISSYKVFLGWLFQTFLYFFVSYLPIKFLHLILCQNIHFFIYINTLIWLFFVHFIKPSRMKRLDPILKILIFTIVDVVFCLWFFINWAVKRLIFTTTKIIISFKILSLFWRL